MNTIKKHNLITFSLGILVILFIFSSILIIDFYYEKDSYERLHNEKIKLLITNISIISYNIPIEDNYTLIYINRTLWYGVDTYQRCGCGNVTEQFEPKVNISILVPDYIYENDFIEHCNKKHTHLGIETYEPEPYYLEGIVFLRKELLVDYTNIEYNKVLIADYDEGK